MSYLIIAVLCSVSVSVLLKVLRQHEIDIRQTIVAGYPVACLLTWFLLSPDIGHLEDMGNMAWGIIILLGVLLPAVFVILGRAIESVGIIATDASQRLSLIIPIISSFVIFGETLTMNRVLGIALGVLALLTLLYQPSNSPVLASDAVASTDVTSTEITSQYDDSKTPVWVWLIGVWLGYGVIDILFKQVAKQGTAFPTTLFLSFGLASLLLFIYLLIKRTKWESKALGAGLLLGCLNMGNIYAYIRAHQTLADSPSIVFTGMNVGVIAVASLVGVAVFKERLHVMNIIGLLLAVSCVVVLFWFK